MNTYLVEFSLNGDDSELLDEEVEAASAGAARMKVISLYSEQKPVVIFDCRLVDGGDR